jgi:hypothetical protein
MPAEESQLAGLDEEGLRRLLGELLAANRGTQANFDEIRQQFPLQPSNVADSIPDWSELEEGGLEPPEQAGEDFAEQLGVPEGIPIARFCMRQRIAGEGDEASEGLKYTRISKGHFYIEFDKSLGYEGLPPNAMSVVVLESSESFAIVCEVGILEEVIHLHFKRTDTLAAVDCNWHFSIIL